MIHHRIEPKDLGCDDRHEDPFECDECGGKILRDCVDFDGVCDLCKLEEKAQRQLPAPKLQSQPPMVCKRCGALTPPTGKNAPHRFGTLCAPCLQDTEALAAQSVTFKAILRRFQ